MNIALVVPMLTALAIALVTTALHRRVRPQLSAALLTGAILGVAAGVVPTMVVLSIGFLVHLPYLGGGFEWCRTVLGFHASVNPWLGAATTGLLAVGIVRVGRSVRAWSQYRCADAGAPALVDSDEWFAYSFRGLVSELRCLRVWSRRSTVTSSKYWPTNVVMRSTGTTAIFSPPNWLWVSCRHSSGCGAVFGSRSSGGPTK